MWQRGPGVGQERGWLRGGAGGKGGELIQQFDEHNKPVKIISIALDFPMALMSLCVPPAPGITPRVISG